MCWVQIIISSFEMFILMPILLPLGLCHLGWLPHSSPPIPHISQLHNWLWKIDIMIWCMTPTNFMFRRKLHLQDRRWRHQGSFETVVRLHQVHNVISQKTLTWTYAYCIWRCDSVLYDMYTEDSTYYVLQFRLLRINKTVLLQSMHGSIMHKPIFIQDSHWFT